MREDRERFVEWLFLQVSVLARAIPSLYAVLGAIDDTRRLTVPEALAHAKRLRGLGVTLRPRSRVFVEEVVPKATPHNDLEQVAVNAINGNPTAQVTIRDAWEIFRGACVEMNLPPTATNAACAYLARELQRLADDEIALGLHDGPATQLALHPAKLAARAREHGIDRDPGDAADRWRHRLSKRAA